MSPMSIPTKRLADWISTGQYFSYGPHQIFFRMSAPVSGVARPTLLLLHGFPTASWDWHKVWPLLASHYQLVAFDFLGFGLSAKPRRHTYSMMEQASIAEALMAHLEIDKYGLLAHDYGATVAQELLARHTKGNGMLERLVLLNGGIFPGLHHPRPIQQALASPFGLFLTPFLNRKKLARNFRAIFGPDTQPTEEELDEFYALMDLQRGKYIFHRLIRYMHQRRTHEQRWVGALTQPLDIPLRLINGTFDPISGGHVADYYEQVVPNPDVVRLDGIGHYPQTEAPERVVEAVLSSTI
jgi:pimeloyl-ACP methyl ester carboxylesterase